MIELYNVPYFGRQITVVYFLHAIEFLIFMTTINPYFTFEYSQPKDYKFSHDSVFFARKVFEIYKIQSLKNFRCLDLCSGCGIIGLDFIFHFLNEKNDFQHSFDFIDIQEIYREHFALNLKKLRNKFNISLDSITFFLDNYKNLKNPSFSEKYDLILCNPPYFFKEMGKLSPSEFKNRCRFFMDANFFQLLDGIANALSTKGSAYLIMRDLSKNGWDTQYEIEKYLDGRLKVIPHEKIRGQLFLRLVKTNSTT